MLIWVSRSMLTGAIYVKDSNIWRDTHICLCYIKFVGENMVFPNFGRTYVKDSFFIVLLFNKASCDAHEHKMLGSGRGGEIQINLKVQIFYPSKNYNRKNCDSLVGTLVLIFAYVVDKIWNSNFLLDKEKFYSTKCIHSLHREYMFISNFWDLHVRLFIRVYISWAISGNLA